MSKLKREFVIEAANAFQLEGSILDAQPYGGGHINDTFAVECGRVNNSIKRYIVQRINTRVFQNPVGLMENIVGITTYLGRLIHKNGGDSTRETLTVIPTHNGGFWHIDSEGGYWRCYHFIEDTLTYNQVSAVAGGLSR